MLPQYIITLGARTAFHHDANQRATFDEKDYKTIEKMVREQSGFDSCTVIRAKGIYRGQEEDTVQIVILEEDYRKIKNCAQKLRRTFRQKSVLVVCAGVGEFLT